MDLSERGMHLERVTDNQDKAEQISRGRRFKSGPAHLCHEFNHLATLSPEARVNSNLSKKLRLRMGILFQH